MGRRAWVAVLAGCLAFPAMPADERESFDLRVPHAPGPVTTDGVARLFYELHVVNFTRQPLAPVRLEILDGASGATLAQHGDADLASRLAPVVRGAGVEAGALAPGAMAVVYLELQLPPDAVPATLRHRVSYRAGNDPQLEASVVGGDVAIDPRPALVFGPPLRGGPWAAVFHPAWERGHRRVFYAVEGRATLPGRLAIDFVKLDAQGRIAAGDPDVIGNAYGHGQPVLAVADAVVAAVRNDYPEAERISENGRHPLSAGSGNYVMLDLGDGRHAVYEHLRPGSVRVSPGQRVRRGDVIGEVGLSGSGGWPHLHFHVADAASLLGAEGLPFAFEGFTVLGAFGTNDEIGQQAWMPRSGGASQRSRERPVDNAVVVFPE